MFCVQIGLERTLKWVMKFKLGHEKFREEILLGHIWVMKRKKDA